MACLRYHALWGIPNYNQRLPTYLKCGSLPLPDDRFVIVACDGLWDVLSNQKAVDIVDLFRCPVRAAIALRDYAYCLGSMDNISVIVYRLDDAVKFKDLNLFRSRYARTGSGGLPNISTQSRSSSGDHKSRSGGSSGNSARRCSTSGNERPRSGGVPGDEGIIWFVDGMEAAVDDVGVKGTRDGDDRDTFGEGGKSKNTSNGKDMETDKVSTSLTSSPVVAKKFEFRNIKTPIKKSRTLQVQVPQTKTPKSSSSRRSRSPSPPSMILSFPTMTSQMQGGSSGGGGSAGGGGGPGETVTVRAFQKTLSLDSARGVRAKSGTTGPEKEQNVITQKETECDPKRKKKSEESDSSTSEENSLEGDGEDQ